jgi:hypothetical protein
MFFNKCSTLSIVVFLIRLSIICFVDVEQLATLSTHLLADLIPVLKERLEPIHLVDDELLTIREDVPTSKRT